MAAWTADTLCTHFEEVLRLRDESIAGRFKEVERAVDLARDAALREMEAAAAALGHRLDMLNDLRRTYERHERRGASVDQLETVQAKLETRLNALDSRLDEIAKRLDQASGARAGAARMWGLLSGGIAAIAMILSIVANL